MSLVENLKKLWKGPIVKTIIKIISDSTRLEKLEYLGYKFEEIPNQWSRHNRKTLTPQQKKLMKMIEDNPELNGSLKIDDKTEHELNYIFSWDYTEEETIYEVIAKSKTKISEKNKEKLIEMLSELEKHKNKIFYKGDVKIVNKSGFNDDERGSNFCILDIPYYETIEMESPTLNDVVEMFYSVKSHKFENWYELYTDCKVTYKNGTMIIELEFDHGS